MSHKRNAMIKIKRINIFNVKFELQLIIKTKNMVFN